MESLIGAVNAEGELVNPAGLDPPGLGPVRRLFSALSDARMQPFYERVLLALRLGPLEKLARCPICGKFFLKARKDQKCCTRPCANRFRVQKWREKYQESYKAQRDRKAQARERKR
jgi:hypothetical protein